MPNVATDFKTFLFELFENNHVFKLSDATLEGIIRQQYPDSLLDIPLDGSRTRLRIWRSEYNRGLLPQLPSAYSFRYASGVPCTGRENPLTDEQIAIRLAKFERNRRAGFVKEEERTD